MNGVTDEDFANGFEDGAGFWTWLAKKCEGPWSVLWVPVSVILLLIALAVLFVFGAAICLWDWLRGDTLRWKRSGERYRATERAERAESTESAERTERA